jgi:hypothetical protein
MPDTAGVDTTADTTQGATRCNREQPRAKKAAQISRFCNLQQRLETGVGGLWLRRPLPKARRKVTVPTRVSL